MERPVDLIHEAPGLFLLAAVLVLTGCENQSVGDDGSGAGDQTRSEVAANEVDVPNYGVVQLRSMSDSDVEGLIQIRAEGEGVRLTGRVTGLSPGKHGFHVHQYGDLSDPTGKSAGSHFNPTDQRHGGPSDEEHHAGDLGNIEANDQGEATVDVAAPWLKLHFILGRGMVVHGGEDDLTSQPSGDAGDRVAVGVIGIGNPDASGR